MKSSNPITDYLLHASNFLPAIVFLFYGRLGPEQPAACSRSCTAHG